MSTISASVTNQPITATVSASGAVTASVGSTAVSVAVGGGVGPQGPQGESGASTWNDITGKPSTFPPSTHQHVVGDVTGLQAALDGKQASGSYAAAVHAHSWSDITSGVPSTFTPPAATASVLGGVKQGSNVTIGVDGTISVAAPFSGSYSDLTGRPTLGTAAASASTDFAAASHTHTLSSLTQSSATSGQVISWSGSAWVASTPFSGSYADLTSKPTLGTAAAAATSDFAAAIHSHAASEITSGTIDVARLPVGTGSTQVAAGNDSRFSDSRSPTAHTHPLSELSQSGATTNQVAQWNGSAWVPATVSGGGGSSSASDLTSGTLNDARLSAKSQSAMNLYLWSNFR